MDRFNTIDEAKRMCPELYVQHVATYRNGESEAGYWGEVDSATHKVCPRPVFPGPRKTSLQMRDWLANIQFRSAWIRIAVKV